MKTLLKFKTGYLLILLCMVTLIGCNNKQKTEAVQQQPVKYTVNIEGMKFQPDTITIHRGDTLLFTNNDMVAHDVSHYPDKSWASPLLQSGDSWTFVPTESTPYFCSIHQVMKGQIIIQ